MKISTEQKLKQLQSQLAKINAKISSLNTEILILTDEINKQQNKRDNIIEEINKIKETSTKPIISEHAILQFIARVLEYDIELIKNQILPDNYVELINLGNGTYPIKTDGKEFKIVVRNNTVLTVIK